MQEKKSKKSGSLAKEPKDRKVIQFYLNHSFLRTQEKKDQKLWQVNPSNITSMGRFFGSCIYEDSGTHGLRLDFVTAYTNGSS